MKKTSGLPFALAPEAGFYRTPRGTNQGLRDRYGHLAAPQRTFQGFSWWALVAELRALIGA